MGERCEIIVEGDLKICVWEQAVDNVSFYIKQLKHRLCDIVLEQMEVDKN